VPNGLDDVRLVELFTWSSEGFDAGLAGSPTQRIGHEQWLRNLAVGLATPSSPAVLNALQPRSDDPSLVREHVRWAMQSHEDRRVLPAFHETAKRSDGIHFTITVYRPMEESVLKSNFPVVLELIRFNLPGLQNKARQQACTDGCFSLMRRAKGL
jgi:hypothetical protein